MQILKRAVQDLQEPYKHYSSGVARLEVTDSQPVCLKFPVQHQAATALPLVVFELMDQK